MELWLQQLTDALDEVIWAFSAAELQAAEPAFGGYFAALGVGLRTMLEGLPDESLALSLQRRFFCKQTFEELFVRRYEPELKQWIAQNTKDTTLQEDLPQELYVKLYKGKDLDHYDVNRPFRPWFWQVVRHLLIDGQRKQRVREQFIDCATPAPGPPEEAIFSELGDQVEYALADLPPHQQQILRGIMQGRDAATLANDLGASVAYVYRHLFYARRALRCRLSSFLAQ